MVSISEYLKGVGGLGSPLAGGAGGVRSAAPPPSLGPVGALGVEPEEEKNRKLKWWEELGYPRGMRGKFLAMAGEKTKQLDDLYAQLLPLIGEATEGAFLQQTEALGAGREHSLDVAAQQFAAAGGAPSMFASKITPELDRDYFNQVGQLRGAAQSARAGSEAGLLSELTSSKIGLEQYYDALREQKAISNEAVHSANRAGELALGGKALELIGSLASL